MNGPIYVPKGHAEPYARFALNPYLTCPERCPYCYNAVRNPAFFSDTPKIRGGSVEKLLAELDKQCASWDDVKAPVHMTFLGDAYQPAEAELKLTRRCIEVLHQYEFPVQILTKARELPARDFDLLTRDGDKLGITLVEPNPRIDLLQRADALGIPIWLSLEPIIALAPAIEVLRDIANLALPVNPLWIGPLNHRSRAYDWSVVKSRLAVEADILGLVVQFKDDATKEKP